MQWNIFLYNFSVLIEKMRSFVMVSLIQSPRSNLRWPHINQVFIARAHADPHAWNMPRQSLNNHISLKWLSNETIGNSERKPNSQ